MPFFTDQLGRVIQLLHSPLKIVSLVPSQTELLFDLGLESEVIGITKFCIHPEHWFKNKARVGGTKNINIKTVKEIHPDLIIANKEENNKSQIEELAINYPVWISDISTLEDALDMIVSIGEMVDRKLQAQKMTDSIKAGFDELQRNISADRYQDLTAGYLIWRNPYMAAGGNTFIHNMMKYCGFKNIFESHERYPTVSDFEKIKMEDRNAAMGCQLLLLSSEPYPFRQKHIDEIQSLLPGTKIILVDGEMFSWYGSRLLQAPRYFLQLRREIQQ